MLNVDFNVYIVVYLKWDIYNWSLHCGQLWIMHDVLTALCTEREFSERMSVSAVGI